MKNVYCNSVLVCMMFSVSFAQDSSETNKTFRIADYKPTKFFTQSLSIEPGIYLSGYKATDSSAYNSEEIFQNTSGSYQSKVNHTLRNHKENSDFEQFSALELYGYPSTTRNKYEDNYVRSSYGYFDANYLNYSISHYSRYRYYLKHGFFVEGTTSPGIGQTLFNNRYEESGSIRNSPDTTVWYSFQKDTSRLQSIKVYCEFAASVGYGWIADVTGASVASYIIDRIALINGYRPVISNVQMRDFAVFIDKFRRKRIFDQSLESIETIDTLCQYLLNNKIISRESARLGMELDYAWTYGFYQPRYSGKEFKCTPFVTGVFDKRNYKQKTRLFDTARIGTLNVKAWDYRFRDNQLTDAINDSTHTSLLAHYGLIFRAGYSKPLNRYFSLDGSLEGIGSIFTIQDTCTFSGNSNYSFLRSYPNARGTASFALLWYPSLRSSLKWANNLLISKDYRLYSNKLYATDTNFNLETNPSTTTYTKIGTYLYFEHYISNKLSITNSVGVDYNSGKNRSTTYEAMRDYNNYYYYYWDKRRFSYHLESRLTYFVF